jgi:hypothetical protein
VVLSAVATVSTEPAPSPPLSPPPPPPQPPIGKLLNTYVEPTRGGLCNASGDARRGNRTVVGNRTDVIAYDAANNEANRCGATPVCAQTESRDVVFVVDASNAVGDALFYGRGLHSSTFQLNLSRF